MGDMADHYIDLALDSEFYGHASGIGRRSRQGYIGQNSINSILTGKYWVDQYERKMYPTKPPHAGGMSLYHIQSVKAYLLREFGKNRVEGTPLWDALCEGEQMHEGDLRKTKNLNDGVIKW